MANKIEYFRVTCRFGNMIYEEFTDHEGMELFVEAVDIGVTGKWILRVSAENTNTRITYMFDGWRQTYDQWEDFANGDLNINDGIGTSCHVRGDNYIFATRLHYKHPLIRVRVPVIVLGPLIMGAVDAVVSAGAYEFMAESLSDSDATDEDSSSE